MVDVDQKFSTALTDLKTILVTLSGGKGVMLHKVPVELSSCQSDLDLISRAENISTTEKSKLIETFNESTELLKTLTKIPSQKELERCEKRAVDKLNDEDVGMEIGFENSLYTHHAIILRIINDKIFEVEHFSGYPWNGWYSFLSLFFSSGQPCLRKMMELGKAGKMSGHVYENIAFPNEIVVRRAEIFYEEFHNLDLKDRKYHLFTSNCQHFASYCSTGSFYSGDVDKTGVSPINDDLTKKMNTWVCRHILKNLCTFTKKFLKEKGLVVENV